jgi:hypothetical protein
VAAYLRDRALPASVVRDIRLHVERLALEDFFLFPNAIMNPIGSPPLDADIFRLTCNIDMALADDVGVGGVRKAGTRA